MTEQHKGKVNKTPLVVITEEGKLVHISTPMAGNFSEHKPSSTRAAGGEDGMGGQPPYLCFAHTSLWKPLMRDGSSALTLHDVNIGHSAVTRSPWIVSLISANTGTPTTFQKTGQTKSEVRPQPAAGVTEETARYTLV